MSGMSIDKIWVDFKNLLTSEQKDSYPPFFYSYHKNLIYKRVFNREVMNLKYLFELSQKSIKGKKILDVGCGFGIDGVILSVLGASEVHGIDNKPQWIDTINRYIKELKWEISLKVQSGYASHLPYQDNYFDVLISIEAISHFRDLEKFIPEAYRVLKKDGALIISDGNNGANGMTRHQTYKIWERFENGPLSENYYGHPIKKTFKEMRRELIKKKYPNMGGGEVDLIVENTFGMGKDQLYQACDNYVRNGINPNRPYKRRQPPFNPVADGYIERLIHPKRFARQMRNQGFRVSVYSHFGGAGSRNILYFLNKVLRFFTPITIYFARSFKMVAVKT